MSGGLDPDIKEDVDRVKGKSALCIWRDNKGDMEKVPENEYGKFYKGDCYVIYNAIMKKNRSKPILDIHFLIGSESEGQDEQMDVAVFATKLDDYLGGAGVQFRELMEHESVEFKAIFNGKKAPNIRYAKGGYESRMKKMDNSNRTQLYEIKGARIAQAVEIDVKLANCNSDDCYVLDGGKKLFVILGEKANHHEKGKAIALARSIRDNEQGGRGRIVIIREEELQTHSDRDEIRKLFQLPTSAKLQFGNLRRLQQRSDEDADKQALNSKLYKISDTDDKVEIKELGPPKQSLLDENDCFILFTGKHVYVWKGRKASLTERRGAIETAKCFLEKLGENPNLGIVVMPQFAETAAFRACFPSWSDDSAVNVDFSRPYGSGAGVARSVHTVIDFRTLYEKPKTDVRIDDPFSDDDGQSSFKIYKVHLPNNGDNDDDKMLVSSGRNMVFNSSESYVIVYDLNGGRGIVYFWLGNDCPQLEKGMAGKIASDIDKNAFGGNAVEERVVEGKEPPHFMRIFGGLIVVKQEVFNRETTHLFHVKGKRENDARAVEVKPDASNLNSNDCFILYSDKGSFIWCGKGSTGDERDATKRAADMVIQRSKPDLITLEEGNESKTFWDIIGGKKAYSTENTEECEETPTKTEPRLYHCFNIRGSLEVEEVFDFDQDDLNPDDVFFLDNYDHLYIWVGKNARRDEKEDTIGFVQQFIKEDPSPREGADNIRTIKQGAEPARFKAFFGAWEDHRMETMTAEDCTRLAMKNNDNEVSLDYKEEDPKGKYTLEELQVPPDELPDDVDVGKRELYLQDDEFSEVFGMTKEDYKKLPKWRRDVLRKRNKLF